MRRRFEAFISNAMMAFNNYIVSFNSGTDLANKFRCKKAASAALSRTKGTCHALTANESPSIYMYDKKE